MAEEWNHGGRMFNPESPGDSGALAVVAAAFVVALALAVAWSRTPQKDGETA